MRGESYTAYFIRAIRFLSMGGRVNKFYISASSNIEFCYVMIISIIFLQTLHRCIYIYFLHCIFLRKYNTYITNRIDQIKIYKS